MLLSQQPVYTYLDEFGFSDTSVAKLRGPARVISHAGRLGINTTSIRSAVEMKRHTLKSPRGTASIWFLPLEDLSSYDPKPGFSRSNPEFYTYPFLSDNANPQAYNAAAFKLAWTPRWHPSLTALFGKGSFYEEAFNPPHKAFISVSHAVFKKNTWYQLALTWDYGKDVYNLYLNGILIGNQNHFNDAKFYRDSVGPSLYTGNPSVAFSTVKFYDIALGENEVYADFKRNATSFDKALEHELVSTYNGTGKGLFTFAPDAS